MSELILPTSESVREDFLRVTRFLGTVLDVYDGYFMDGGVEIRVIIDTTEHPQAEDGEFYTNSTHKIDVYETSIDGTSRKVLAPDANRYPFSERVEADAVRVPLAMALDKQFAGMTAPPGSDLEQAMLAAQNRVILQGPNWPKDGNLA